MQTNAAVLNAGIFLATTMAAFSQPTITSLRLGGQAATVKDTSHFYLSNSVSPGANLVFKVTAGGTPPLHYQWQFNLSDLQGQTNGSLVLTNVQLANAGDYTVMVTNAAGVTNRTVALTLDSTFTKISTGSVVTDIGYSPGGTWGDYNKDGLLDLFVFNGMDGNSYVPFLYRNSGDGTFSKVTSGPPGNLPAESKSACWGDYDNDGNLDLFLATTGVNLLYRNNGDGTFTRITTGSIVKDIAYTLGAAWADYDNDGLLDLFVTTFDPTANSHAFLYLNNGDGSFSSISNSITELESSLGCAWGDYDNDGHLDLFVSGGRGPDVPLAPNRLYHSNGDGTFTKIITGSIVTDVGYSGSCAWGDYDNDGYLDLFVANSFGLKNSLYHNNGDGTFNRVTSGIVANDIGYSSKGCAWGDYDNDGLLDLFVTNDGDTGIAPTVVNFLYHNNGDGTFTKITTGSPANEYSDSEGASWVDYDNDGFLDLFASRGNGRGNYLYRNNGNSNAWLTVKLIGTASNRSAIGAKVRVEAVIGGLSRWQLRQITGGTGFLGHNELQANFGLGDATNIDQVRIEWPSGVVQTITGVATNQFLTVVEHQEPGPVTEPSFTSVSRSTDGSVDLSVTGDAGFLYLFEASTNLVNWSWLGVRSNATGNIQFIDPRATNFTKRFYRVSVP